MPVEPRELNGGMIEGRKAASPRPNYERSQQSDSDNHVHGVHSRHSKVKREKDFRRARQGSVKSKRTAGNQMLLEFGVIFVKLDAKESEPQNNGQNQESNQRLPSARFRAIDSQRHGEATANQHGCIDGSKPQVQVVARAGKRLYIPVSVDEVTRKHTAKEHDLRRKKYPHA